MEYVAEPFVAETVERTNEFSVGASRGAIGRAINAALRDLVSVKHRPGGSFVRLPVLYPSGSSTRVRVDGGPNEFFVSDYGGGYEEADIMGGLATFARVARPIAERSGIGFDQHSFFVMKASAAQLAGAMATIASCSQEAVNTTALKVAERKEKDRLALLHNLLDETFPQGSVTKSAEFVGNSNTVWPVAALVRQGRREAIFETVTANHTSVATVSTKFNDFLRLERPPGRVVFTPNKSALGTYLGVLSPISNVVEFNVSPRRLPELAELGQEAA